MRKRWILLIVLLTLLAAAYIAYLQYVLGSAEVAEEISVHTWSEGHIVDIPVALDVAVNGDVYIAETGQFGEGVGISVPNASAAMVSMMRLTHSSCTALRGVLNRVKAPINATAKATTFTVNWN